MFVVLVGVCHHKVSTRTFHCCLVNWIAGWTSLHGTYSDAMLPISGVLRCSTDSAAFSVSADAHSTVKHGGSRCDPILPSGTDKELMVGVFAEDLVVRQIDLELAKGPTLMCLRSA